MRARKKRLLNFNDEVMVYEVLQFDEEPSPRERTFSPPPDRGMGHKSWFHTKVSTDSPSPRSENSLESIEHKAEVDSLNLGSNEDDTPKPTENQVEKEADSAEQKEEDESVLRAKVLLIGDSGVGKTSLADVFRKGRLTDHYNPTIAADFYKMPVKLEDGQTALLQLWDTAG